VKHYGPHALSGVRLGVRKAPCSASGLSFAKLTGDSASTCPWIFPLQEMFPVAEAL